MSEAPPEPAGPAPAPPRPTHWLQRVLDNPWLLLVIGVVVPTLSYTVWGTVELLMQADAKLP